ncbi:hypothetical protein KIW84_045379 [Lathyrus oleraceus]|uniref:Reverse transcriptase n=1 Tax=Pisum sativum TaxID=3888 RepID=A0A9D4XIY4_PEA|nr:hypothetical protein KIW84_045379 [Pisum sativum]
MCKLNEELKDEEIKQAIFDMTAWNSPESNGYSASFFQQSWNVVGNNVCSLIQYLWDNPSKINEINQTEICLIPKINSSEQVSQFRPIALYDLILFGKSIIQQITCITKVPRNLCEASSQRVSVDKSRILFSKNTHMHISNQIVQVSGLKETKELGMYLWEPLTRLHPRVKRYQYLVDKMNRRDKNVTWKSLWATTCHQLRYWRNQRIYVSDFVSLCNIVDDIKAKVRSYQQSMVLQNKIHQRSITTIAFDWKRHEKD